MAYVTTNPPRRLEEPGLYRGNSGASTAAVGGGIWIYVSADSAATVIGAGYITNPGDLGMLLNDVVLIIDTNTPAATFARVSARTTTSTTMVQMTTPA